MGLSFYAMKMKSFTGSFPNFKGTMLLQAKKQEGMFVGSPVVSKEYPIKFSVAESNIVNFCSIIESEGGANFFPTSCGAVTSLGWTLSASVCSGPAGLGVVKVDSLGNVVVTQYLTGQEFN